jgi:hypothetical protein
MLVAFKNDDLKTKNYLLKALIKLINIEEYSMEEDEMIDVSCNIRYILNMGYFE